MSLSPNVMKLASLLKRAAGLPDEGAGTFKPWSTGESSEESEVDMSDQNSPDDYIDEKEKKEERTDKVIEYLRYQRMLDDEGLILDEVENEIKNTGSKWFKNHYVPAGFSSPAEMEQAYFEVNF